MTEKSKPAKAWLKSQKPAKAWLESQKPAKAWLKSQKPAKTSLKKSPKKTLEKHTKIVTKYSIEWLRFIPYTYKSNQNTKKLAKLRKSYI